MDQNALAIYVLVAYNSVFFSSFTESCNHHNNQFLSAPKRNSEPISSDNVIHWQRPWGEFRMEEKQEAFYAMDTGPT